jgi:N,N'-diacetyllegionaminate synthase
VEQQPIFLAGRPVGVGQPCFVIAEAGVNHNGDMELARRLIDMAAGAGADAVKFQTFRADLLTTATAAKAAYQIQQTGAAESQHAMLRRLELSAADHAHLWRHARERNILFMSTPFDETSADLLDELGVAVYKIPSGEVTNLPLLAHIARKGKPLIMSTGMASLGEVEAAVEAIRAEENEHLILLQCVSNYPADPADSNLRVMELMARAFGALVGYSDHTLGIDVSLAAVALGACVIEKHVTLDRTLPGPDHQASAEPAELTALVRGIRTVEAALGHGRKVPAASESATAAVARRSLVALRDVPPGAVLTPDTIGVRRPGTGLPPALRLLLVGRTAKTGIRAGTLLTLDMVA